LLIIHLEKSNQLEELKSSLNIFNKCIDKKNYFSFAFS